MGVREGGAFSGLPRRVRRASALFRVLGLGLMAHRSSSVGPRAPSAPAPSVVAATSPLSPLHLLPTPSARSRGRGLPPLKQAPAAWAWGDQAASKAATTVLGMSQVCACVWWWWPGGRRRRIELQASRHLASLSLFLALLKASRCHGQIRLEILASRLLAVAA